MNKGIKDKDWEVLPKELRERVKDVYKTAKQVCEYPACEGDKINSIGAMQALEALFDEHNLISDTEAEPAEPKFKIGQRMQNDTIDWEQRRYEMAKDFTAVMLGRLNYDPFEAILNCCCSGDVPVNPYRRIIRIAVSVADAVIEELRKPKNQENDVQHI